MKLLFFDRSGFVLVLKRLTEDKFRWPRRQEAVVTLTTEQLHWILDGIDNIVHVGLSQRPGQSRAHRSSGLSAGPRPDPPAGLPRRLPWHRDE